MKKQICLLAALTASAAANAQSSITLFGIVDASVGYISTQGGGHTVGLFNGENSTSRLGFRGTEDLGGGLSASFWLEGQLNNDVGAGATQTTAFDFTRRSTVSLSGNFGEVRLGRDFAMGYLSLPYFDPYGVRGLGAFETSGLAIGGMTGVNGTTRVSNSIAYFLPSTLGGLYGGVQLAFGERNSNANATTNAAGISTSAANAATTKTGNYAGARLGYKFGAADIAAGYGVFYDAVRGTSANTFYADDYKVGNIGGSYDFSVVKFSALFQNEKIDGRGAAGGYELNSYFLAAQAPIGASVLKAAVSRYDVKNSAYEANKFSVGYAYFLSKRTAIYADVARIMNKGTGTLAFGLTGASIPNPAITGGRDTTGVAVGIRHAF